MTRKDIIIIAALVNASLLAILFMMAINSDDDGISDAPVKIEQPIATLTPVEIAPLETKASVLDDKTHTYTAVETLVEDPNAEPLLILDEDPIILEQDEDVPLTKKRPKKDTLTEAPSDPQPQSKPTDPQLKYVEVTVKRGDSLDKIARANGTTISAIKDANNLKNDRLNVGQVLRIPIGSVPKSIPEKSVAQTTNTTSTQTTPAPQGSAQYYTVKAGDNPSKIAKQFNLKTEELLKLNNMSEEKARNLRIGDKIRVR